MKDREEEIIKLGRSAQKVLKEGMRCVRDMRRNEIASAEALVEALLELENSIPARIKQRKDDQ